MNLPFFKKTSKPANRFLTIDISADSVKCLAFYVDTNNMAKIIGSGTKFLEPHAVRSGNIVDFRDVEEATREAIAEATESSGGKISDVIFGVSNDLSLGLMTTAKSSRGRAGPIEESDIEQINQRIMDSALIQARNEMLQITGNADLEIEPVTASVVYTKVNNQIVKDPFGAEGESVEVAMFTAFAPQHHVKNLQKLAKSLRLKIVAIGSTMFSLVNCLRLANPDLMDYIVMDFGSDVTDVGVVFGNGIVSTRSLHIGGAHFTREISQKMGLSLREAERMKRNYSYGKLSNSETNLVQNSIQETLDVWLNGIELLFGEFTGVKTFASRIFLAGGGIKLPDIHDYVTQEPWTKGIPFRAPPEFTKLKMEDLKTVTDSTGKVTSVEYVLPASLSIIYLEMNGFLND
jgi:cell division protein FtsA